jgi:Zn-dependent protease with chaperone function
MTEYDAASAAVEAALAAGARYADARVMHRRHESMDARNGEIEELTQDESAGVGVRALVGSSWGFYAVPDLSDAAARAAGDDPARYSFAMLRSRHIGAYHTDDAIFYFSDGLARQPAAHVDALVAHEVAHEILGHAGRRAAVALGTTAGLTVMGVIVPGLSLADLVINPLIVRAFSRDQEIAADLRAVDVLGAMGHDCPRRTLADALRAAAAINGQAPGGFFATEPTLEERLAALEPLEPDGTPQTSAAQRAAPTP